MTKKDAVDMTFPTSDALLSMNWEGSTDDRITLKKQTLQSKHCPFYFDHLKNKFKKGMLNILGRGDFWFVLQEYILFKRTVTK